MIYGIGTDIVRIDRLSRMWERHGQRAAERLLVPPELVALTENSDKGRFLAKRFAAKEAFAKAMGTGIRGVVGFASIEVAHNGLGKPVFVFHGALAERVRELGVSCHLSISDEADFAIAYVILEKI